MQVTKTTEATEKPDRKLGRKISGNPIFANTPRAIRGKCGGVWEIDVERDDFSLACGARARARPGAERFTVRVRFLEAFRYNLTVNNGRGTSRA